MSVARPALAAHTAEQIRPVALAGEQVLPLLPALESLVPWGGLARGVTVACRGLAATSMALATTAAASAAGAWVVGVGCPRLGLAAAADLGVALTRFALVEADDSWSPERWAQVLGALVGGVDLVVVGRDSRVRPGDARRLTARARERGTTLVLAGAHPRWSEAPDLDLRVVEASWQGIGQGHGHLRARQVHVEASGRRQAARPRSADLWLLDPDGRVAPIEPTASVTVLAPKGRAR